ncbi:hypothetical protein CSA37_08215 [Candidatus Fermentibacteria bacterium]|nr:MAG: hypothetical protein CSA37_08215 [Candidatus Fermentibacteria bacterium]
MVVFLPCRWGEEILSDCRFSVSCDYTVEGVRKALSQGKRTFLIGADALSNSSGWKTACDHLSLFGTGVLAGPNDDRFGPRFPNLRGMYLVPNLFQESVTVMQVPDIAFSTGAELSGFPCGALISEGLDLAVTAAHGGAKVVFALRCHKPGERADNDFSFLKKVIQEIEGGEE